MTLSEEILRPDSCLNKADHDELIFVLLARDKSATKAVWAWIQDRIDKGTNKLGDSKIQEAIAWICKVENQHFKGGSYNSNRRVE